MEASTAVAPRDPTTEFEQGTFCNNLSFFCFPASTIVVETQLTVNLTGGVTQKLLKEAFAAALCECGAPVSKYNVAITRYTPTGFSL